MSVSQETLEKRIRSVYTQAQKDLQKKLDDYIVKFRKKDAQMRQELAEEAITQKEYDEWRRGAIFQGKAWRARLKQVTDTLANANEESLRLVRGEQLNEFAEGMNHEQFVLAQNTGLSINFGIYDADTVGRLIREQPDLLPPKKLNRGKDERWNQKKITGSVLQGIIQGESIDDIARRIARDTAQQNSKAMIRYARTATTGAQNAGRMETMHRAHGIGINIRKQWLATMDNRTRDSHQRLDGKEAGVDEPFKSEFGDIMFPGDPHADPADVYNCRCTLVYVYPDYPTSPGERLDNITGEHVRGDMTYAEWAGTQLPAVQPNSHANRPGNIEEMKRLISAHQGSWKLDELKAVGKLCADEIQERQKQAIAVDHTAEINELVRKWKELGTAYFDKDLEYRYALIRGSGNAEELEKESKTLKKERDDIQKKIEELEKKRQDQKSAALKSVLSDIRTLGGVTNANAKQFMSISRGGKTADATIDAMNFYPTEWLNHTAAFGITLKPKWTTGRAYYSPANGEIRVDESRGTCIHELGHRFEQVVPGIREAEREFYAKRTEGESLQWLGPGYARTERTRRDKFLSPYMGKDYGGQAFELVSMGFQYAYTDYEKLSQDEDMRDWILGILASI